MAYENMFSEFDEEFNSKLDEDAEKEYWAWVDNEQERLYGISEDL